MEDFVFSDALVECGATLFGTHEALRKAVVTLARSARSEWVAAKREDAASGGISLSDREASYGWAKAFAQASAAEAKALGLVKRVDSERVAEWGKYLSTAVGRVESADDAPVLSEAAKRKAKASKAIGALSNAEWKRLVAQENARRGL